MFHHHRPGTLTFSFSHLFERARALSISLDQDGRHSRIDHRVVMLNTDDTVLERTSGDRRPPSVDLLTRHAGEGHACLERAFPHGEAAAPAPDAIGAGGAVYRGFD
jgi:hypothetical protein